LLDVAIAKPVESEFAGEKRFEYCDGFSADRVEGGDVTTCLAL
jgi:hypothetical protein